MGRPARQTSPHAEQRSVVGSRCGVESLYDSLPSLLAATVAFAIGASGVLRERGRDELVPFAVFCFNLGLIHLARFFHGFTDVAVFAWVGQTISLVLPWSASRCFDNILPVEARPRAPVLRTIGMGALLVAQSIAFFAVVGVAPVEGSVALQVWWWVSIALGTYVVGALGLVLRRIWRAAQAAEGTAKGPRLRYLFVASAVTLALGSPLLPAVGPVVTAVYLYFVAQTLERERLLELPELVAKISTLALLVVAVSAVYAALLLWIPTTGGNSTALFVFNIAVASYTVIVLIDPLRAEIESRIESWLFRDREATRRLLFELRYQLLNVIDPAELAEVMIAALKKSNRVTQASLYLLDAAGTALLLQGELGGQHPPRVDLATRRPLLAALRERGPVLRDVMQRERDRAGAESRAEYEEIIASLSELGATLVVPIFARAPTRTAGVQENLGELLGLICVDDERLLEPFSREEVELFEGLAAQTTITLANSKVYERRKERDRLAALGEMAAGLAHEIRNPLGAIKGAVQIVEPNLRDVDPMTTEFLGVIVEEVERLNRVVQEFLGYSRPYKGEMAQVSASDVIAGTLRSIPAERASLIVREVLEDLPPIRGDADSLRQVMLNLVLNALDAATEAHRQEPDKARVWVEARLRSRALPSGDAVALIVRDNGPGLSDDALANLFVPFHTTKSGGTGLGLPISQRIVEQHGGIIEVGNTSEGGAYFGVLIPVFRASADSQHSLTRASIEQMTVGSEQDDPGTSRSEDANLGTMSDGTRNAS